MKVDIDNTTASSITINGVTILSGVNYTIYDDAANNTLKKGHIDDFLALDGQQVFFEDIFDGTFVIVKDTVNQSVSEAFEVIGNIRILFNAAIDQAALTEYSYAYATA